MECASKLRHGDRGHVTKKKVVILTKLEEIIRNVDTKPPVDLVFHLIIEELI